jgi:curved DNA-binding protein CbpA
LKFIENLYTAPVPPDQIAEICRKLKIAWHPDRTGGSHETFVAIGQAEEVLCS